MSLPTITHFSILFLWTEHSFHHLTILLRSTQTRGRYSLAEVETIMIRTFGVRWLSPLCDLTAKRISRGHPLESVELCKLDSEKLSSGLEFLKQNVRLDLI